MFFTHFYAYYFGAVTRYFGYLKMSSSFLESNPIVRLFFSNASWLCE